MSKRKKRISYPKERALLSDVHPFETPITFSNRYYYRFLVNHNIEFTKNKFNCKNNYKGNLAKAFECITNILFNDQKKNNQILISNLKTIPYKYRISHKKTEFRELSLIHPINQLELVEFYNHFKSLIVYYCSKSSFSIRKPVNVAKLMYFNDKLHQSSKGENSDFLELQGKEYENLKTYFAYESYTNIFQFYEDDKYHHSEKKFDFLKKLDISKCFDSIYSHSITWAILGLAQVKEEVPKSKKTFGGAFDRFIQYCNYSETNGIIIGPEFSRIFSEIILQEIDKRIKIHLETKSILEGRDYAAFRYVDDYFIFYNDQNQIEFFIDTLNHIIRDYKLGLNPKKVDQIERPLITPITIAKQKIQDLFAISPIIKIIDENGNLTKEYRFIEKLKIEFVLNHKEIIVRFKQIVHESKIEYSDILNYSLSLLNSIIENQVNTLHLIYQEYEKREAHEKSQNEKYILELTNSLKTYVWKLLDFSFFIYSTTIKVNSTIKVCHLLSKIIDFLKSKDQNSKHRFNKDSIDFVFKKILDESNYILRKKSKSEFVQLESLYILAAIKELGKNYRINPKVLINYLHKTEKDEDWELQEHSLDYFSIVNLLYYIGNASIYSGIKEKLISYIIQFFEKDAYELFPKSSEKVHLIMDIFTCPYLKKDTKKILYCKFRNAKSQREQNKRNNELEHILEFNKYQKYWFTKWTSVNFRKELYNKKSQEVYAS